MINKIHETKYINKWILNKKKSCKIHNHIKQTVQLNIIFFMQAKKS
jgi:hypothetical protein